MLARPRIVGFLCLFGAFSLLWLGCEAASNPCPVGARPRYDLNRCVPEKETSVGMVTDGGASVSDATLPEQDGSDFDEQDASQGLDEDAGTAPDDASTVPGPDAASPDAAVSNDAGAKDAGVEPLCSRADLDAARDFHVSAGLVDTLITCLAEGCDEATCPAAPCTMEVARVEACEECVEAEARCLIANCGAACSEPGSDPECRACACEADCVRVFEGCAQAPLPVCEGVFGRDSTSDERVVEGPILFKQKSATGLIQSSRLVAAPESAKPTWAFTDHQSAGWTRLLAWSQGGADYLLQYKGACVQAPCRMRVSHVLRDGSLGRPVFEARIEPGFAELELFAVQGRTFVAMYSPTLTTGDAAGTLRILEAVEKSGSLELVTRLERSSRSTTGAWTLLEAFVEGETIYLASYDATTGEVSIDSVAVNSDALTLSALPRSQWESGLTIIETFAFAGETQLLSYRADSGAVRIAPLLPRDGTLALGPTNLEVTWPVKLDHIETFTLGGAPHLLRQARATGAVEIVRIAADSNTWPASFGPAVYVDAWGKKPVWDLVAVVHSGKW